MLFHLPGRNNNSYINVHVQNTKRAYVIANDFRPHM